MPDEFRYEGESLTFAGKNGRGLFTPEHFGMSPLPTCGRCQRGFVMKYDLVEGNLVLNEMVISTRTPEIVNNVEPVKGPNFFDYRYENIGLKTPFTGTLILAKDFIDHVYGRLSLHPTAAFQTVLEIHLEDGDIQVVNDLSSKMEEIRDKGIERILGSEEVTKDSIRKMVEQIIPHDCDFE
jgi:hypothetical protein